MDSVSAANHSLSSGNAAAARPAVTCDKCGRGSLAWVQSKKTGKWYLAEGTRGVGVPPGKVVPVSWNPHFKHCKPKEEE
jgi:hypothetical protein